MSHFIEHMLFKGTRRRSAKQIAAALESIGGQLNAFTSREHTCFNVRVLDEYLDLAMDVLSDMTCHSTMTPTNLRREKQVILEEIKEAWEHPADRVHDEFAEAYWGGHALGQPILGGVENVAGFKRSHVLKYLKRHYRAGSIVITAAGNVSHRRLVDRVRELFEFEEGKADGYTPAQRPHPERLRFANTTIEQTHLCLGFPGIPYDSPMKMAVLALNAHLGGGMSSVIFQKIREVKGLAYSVYTYGDFYSDTGMFGAYVGTDRKHVTQALEIILKELERCRRRKLPTDTLETIKAQLKGQLMLGMESTSARMNRLGRQELYLGRFEPFSEILSRIDALQPSDLMEFARHSFDPSEITVTTLGPVVQKEIRRLVG